MVTMIYNVKKWRSSQKIKKWWISHFKKLLYIYIYIGYYRIIAASVRLSLSIREVPGGTEPAAVKSTKASLSAPRGLPGIWGEVQHVNYPGYD